MPRRPHGGLARGCGRAGARDNARTWSQEKLLFNCPEGTQRLMSQNKLKLSHKVSFQPVVAALLSPLLWKGRMRDMTYHYQKTNGNPTKPYTLNPKPTLDISREI